jgi:hypothetical protein
MKMKTINLLFLFLFFAIFHVSAQKTELSRLSSDASDSMLLDAVQKQTFRYFWDFADPVSGMARERSNVSFGYGNEVSTIGGTGFGVMSIIVAADRKWISRDTAAGRILRLLNFLKNADRYHGMFPHWMNGATGKTIPFGEEDDGADIVETSYLFQGLFCARQYFNKEDSREKEIRLIINKLWREAEWSWFTQGKNVLYWHWSPKYGWKMNFAIHGFNECLITYVMAASSTHHPISAKVYHEGWASGENFVNGKKYFGYALTLGFDQGGPLFFSQYSFLGLDPRKLKDKYADYWMQNTNHTLINYTHCVVNPGMYKGYGKDCWGLTAGDAWNGYNAFSPTNDDGTITPTAALSAFPYTPEKSMKALKYFYFNLGDKIWSEYGFTDGFNQSKNWYAESHLAIDQGPIIVMIENYRSGLMWKLFMSCPEVQYGLRKLGFKF